MTATIGDDLVQNGDAARRARQPVVGIGASAGGIEAFRSFFAHMPADSGLAFVVVLHLPSDRPSILPDILSRWTPMRVAEATDGCVVVANHVYLPPPGVVVVLRRGRLHLLNVVDGESREPNPISIFFDSLAIELHEEAIGIILSGTGSDGALGLKAIKTNGGLTLAQGADGTGPQHSGMPASAIATGAVDIVVPVEDMPDHILAVRQALRETDQQAELSEEQTRAERLAICAVLLRDLGHDFRGYKDKTFLRRVQRRMQVVRVATLSEYVTRVAADRSEAETLFRDLLIGVTSFFRDVETFEAIERTVIPKLFDGLGADAVIRVWVAGCATGEEAYSLAILLHEQADRQTGPRPRIQLFATDIDEPAVAIARAGRYPTSLVQGVSPARLARFFVAGYDGSYAVTKELRDLCTFSAHSLTRDPPFSRINLVSCRNLLIYLDTDLQALVIPSFHYSLVPNGFLLLGSSENIARHENLFLTLDRTHRIFRRRDVPSLPLRPSMIRSRQPGSGVAGSSAGGGLSRSNLTRLGQRANNRVLERFGPAFVVATAAGDIVQYSARTGRFLEPAAGLASQNVVAMGRRGLGTRLRSALRQAEESGRPVEIAGISVAVPGEGTQLITLAVEPLQEPDSPSLFLIMFVETSQPDMETRGPPAEPSPEPGAERQIELELRDTREQLQSITEEHEGALEELRSTNEELLSVNEEMQSTNEELETSKEEIQSINEELQTVNSQLAVKVDELDGKNSDLRNLLESTQVATIFLDQYLIIRGFTPAVADIFNFIPSDIGRPLTDIASRLRYGGLREDVATVLRTLETLERRVVRDDDAAHYLMRVLPYRTPLSTVDGTLITFVDVTSIVQAEQRQRLLVDELNHRVKNMLTVVASIARQTVRRAPSLEAFAEVYMGRVMALSAAYGMLSDAAWQTVAIRDLVMEEVRPFLADDRDNITVHGPHVLLEATAALALGLAVHELTTNAVKYGALSVPEGNVRVEWDVEPASEGGTLMLEWVESDGPRVSLPAHRGFGMTLIERGLKQDMRAQVMLEFAPAGVRARVRAPLRPQPNASDPPEPPQ